MMWKIGKKTQTPHAGLKGKLGGASIKRAVDLCEQAYGAYSPTEERHSPASLPAQMTHGQTYLIEAERKRALALMYASRRTPCM